MSDKKAILAAMLRGQPTPETMQFAQQTKAVTRQTEAGEVIKDYGGTFDGMPDKYKPAINEAVAPQGQPVTFRPQGLTVETSPEAIAALFGGAKRSEIAQKFAPTQEFHMPTTVAQAPQGKVMNEAYMPAPSSAMMLNEAREQIKNIAKEELVGILINEVFSEPRLMKLFESQFEKTMSKFLAKRKAVKK